MYNLEKLVGKRFSNITDLENEICCLLNKKVHCIESESEIPDNTDFMIDYEIDGSVDVYTLFYLKGRGTCKYYITEV